MALRGSIRFFSQKENQRVDRPKRGRIRGTTAVELKPQTTESTFCDFAVVVGRATNSLGYGMYPPPVGRPRAWKNRFIMVIYKESKITPTFLCVTMQSRDEFTFTVPSPDRAFHKVDSSSQIGESPGACGTI